MYALIKKYRFYFLAIFCAVAVWVVDAVIDSAFFSDETFLEELFEASGFEIYFRGIIIVFFLLFALYAHRITQQLNQSNISLQKLSAAIDQADEAICITDNKGIVEFINPAFARYTGFSESEIVGQPMSLIKSEHQDEMFYKQMWATIRAGVSWRGKIFNRRKDGSEFHVMMTISPVDTGNKAKHYIGLMQDLEEHDRLEEQFHQAQKMEAVGTLVGGIAHDFNNTLAAITGSLFLAKEEIKDRPDIVEQLSSIERLSFSAAEMIQQLLAFSRKGVMEMQLISAISLLKEMTRLINTSLPKHIDFRTSFPNDTLLIKGDINQLHQVILNLINNARDAVEDVDHPGITLEVCEFTPDDAFLEKHPGACLQDYVLISVSDNGHGIEEEILEHIYEPFFTTKAVGKGTGLGLSMVYGAVQSHHGLITAESNQPPGTIFNIFLPEVTEKQSVSLEDEHEIAQGHGETILLVDDNLAVLTTGRDILKKLGYHVMTASDGQMAVNLYKTRQNNIDLLILDGLMPRLGGSEALRNIREINPEVKALFLSGYHEYIEDSSNLDAENMIAKPFAVSRLSQRIRQKLDE